MDTLWSVFNWLMVHQPSFPWSLFWAGWTFSLTANFISGCKKEGEKGEGQMSFSFVASFLTMIFIGGVGGILAGPMVTINGQSQIVGYYWYHWISLGLGWIGVPALLAAIYFSRRAVIRTVRGVASAVSRFCRAVAARSSAWRRRRTQEAEATRHVAETSPKGVIARCEAIVEEFKKTLPLDVTSLETRKRAGDLIEALKELFALEERLGRLTPDDEPGLAEKIQLANQLFPEDLEKECPELIASLRRERQAIGPYRRGIHTAIEALVLLIMALPDQAASKIALQMPYEYQQVVNDLRQGDGKSLLPEVVSEPEVPIIPAPSRRGQTA